jgi:hypothetical protein
MLHIHKNRNLYDDFNKRLLLGVLGIIIYYLQKHQIAIRGGPKKSRNKNIAASFDKRNVRLLFRQVVF